MSYKIICPYCFKEFKDTDVHFRMETYFKVDKLNDAGMSENDVLRMPAGDEKSRLMAQMKQRKPFLMRDDVKYNNFWKNFGGTTELTSSKREDMDFEDYQLPVLDPSDSEAQKLLEVQHPQISESCAEKYLIMDRDNMAVALKDIYGRETFRRVCPYCHNPLPLGYGKHEPKFISIIGITGAGKTVYISQMLKYMNKYASYVDMTAYFTSSHETDFINNNPVEMGKPLPGATMAGGMSQPMFYDLVQSTSDDQVKTDTIVIYDIAGENCMNANQMQKYGEFVTRSHGIILLVDPKQLSLLVSEKLSESEHAADPELVLNTIYNAFKSKNSQAKQDIPVAVCISKSDSFAEALSPIAGQDISPVKDELSGDNQPKFNAQEYNQLEPEIKKLLGNDPMVTTLKNSYKNYNFFVFSATGCGVKMNDKNEFTLTAPPVPKRIAEPLLWLFYKFGYIGSSNPIRLPHPRSAPEFIEESQKKLFFTKTIRRPLTEDEKKEYLYEEQY